MRFRGKLSAKLLEEVSWVLKMAQKRGDFFFCFWTLVSEHIKLSAVAATKKIAI